MSGSNSRRPGGSCYLAWFLPSRCCKSCTKRIRAKFLTVFVYITRGLKRKSLTGISDIKTYTEKKYFLDL